MNTSISVSSKDKNIIIGTRRSALAKWQSHYVSQKITACDPEITVELREIITKGDLSQAKDDPLPSIGGKGLFTAELEEALKKGEIDIAVHSLKDLPTELDSRFSIAAVPKRATVNDVLISRGNLKLVELRNGAVIGSSSFRRSAQLLKLRPDLKIESIRGNIDTRIAKVNREDLNYDGILLAMAGLERLELSANISQIFSSKEILPAAGQGALAVQCRSNDTKIIDLLTLINDIESELAVTAERSFLGALGAGCNMPVACLAEVDGEQLTILGRCLSLDGKKVIEVEASGASIDAFVIGKILADRALTQGASQLISSCKSYV